MTLCATSKMSSLRNIPADSCQPGAMSLRRRQSSLAYNRRAFYVTSISGRGSRRNDVCDRPHYKQADSVALGW